MKKLLALLAASSIVVTAPIAFGQDPAATPSSETLFDPLDPFDYLGSDEMIASDDKDKSADELVREAMYLLTSERLLDARTKLLKALQKDPTEYRTYHLLAGYYMVHVGHYRLALKYIKRAQELFEKKHGKPPYSDQIEQLEHSQILYYLSQIRLNLDDYQGSLDVLDEYTKLGYYSDWYAGSRAWVLMKLGKLQEAIRVARLGVIGGSEPGRTLNMLGILLSMNDQRHEALDVFRKAIATEMALGTEGQPATPLNNAGEVYKEMFEDDKAESSFLRATGLPDGCEHVLPSLNLTLLYIDQMKFEAAAGVIDSFQRCVAQFPLRNGEEHVALVNLARGRIDLHTGNIDRAIKRFEAAMEGTQWFGKIGTNQDDLLVATTMSLGQALLRKNNILSFQRPTTWSEWYSIKEQRLENDVRAMWLMRRARQILVDDLKDIEDLSIRNTDSLLEYPSLGEVLDGLSRSSVVRRLEKQKKDDPRPQAHLYYDMYLAESSLGWWHRKEGTELLDQVIERARLKYDELLKLRATLLRMKYLAPSSDRYHDLAYRVLLLSAPALRNEGLRLPVKIDSSGAARALRSAIAGGPFFNSPSPKADCTISATSSAEGSHRIEFSCASSSTLRRVVEDKDPNTVVNKLTDSIFREDISNGGNS